VGQGGSRALSWLAAPTSGALLGLVAGWRVWHVACIRPYGGLAAGLPTMHCSRTFSTVVQSWVVPWHDLYRGEKRALRVVGSVG
jgi:hypothetical protein